MKYATCLLKRYGRVLLAAVAAAVGAAVMLGSTCAVLNKAPTVPVISGPSAGVVSTPVTFTATATDPEGDSVAFQFDWGDTTTPVWSNLIASGETLSQAHTYADTGAFSVKARVKDMSAKESEWCNGVPLCIANGSCYPDSLVRKLYVGGSVEALAVSPDGQRLYVARFNRDELLVVRTDSLLVMDTIPVGDWPTALAINRAGNRLYAACLEGDCVSVIGLPELTTLATIVVGRRPAALAVSLDDSFVFVACRDNDSLVIIDAATNTVGKTIGTGRGPCSVAALPGKRVLVGEGTDSCAAIIDWSSGTVEASVKSNNRVHLVAVTPDMACCLIGGDDGRLAFATADSLSIIGSVVVEGTPAAVAFSPDGSLAFVATGQYARLPVLSLDSHQVVGWLASDGYLDRVVDAPDGQTIFATDDARGIYVYAK